MKNNQLPLADPLLNERTSLALASLLACFMLVCVAVPIIGFGERIMPGWNGSYLLPAVFIVALEAMISWRAARRLLFPSAEWLAYRGTEFVVVALGLKVYFYIMRGWGTFLADLARLQQDPRTFFDGEYLFAFALAAAVWAVATHFAIQFADLEGDDLLLTVEYDSKIESDRAAARRRLLADIFSFGGLMLFLTAILRNNLAFLGYPASPLQTGLLYVVLYFILGLVLLAQSQFAVLRARWIIDRIPIHQNIAPRWAIYSVALLLICSGLVLFLPTRYSLGLLEVLSYIFVFFQIVVAIILFLISLLVNSLASLFGRQPPSDQAAQLPDFSELAPALDPASSHAWLEIVKSILFWIFFLTVIGFSLYYYFRSRADLLSKIPRFPFPKLNFRFPRIRFPRRFQRPVLSPFRFLNLRRLSPRDRVRFYYLALLRRADVQRKPAQTPYEYQKTLTHLPPDDLSALTGEFVEAQYSRHEITSTFANAAKSHWEKLKAALRSHLRS